ncbi:MAG TPA: NAD-dependent epimerase/dehydratase family protein [Methanocella sp.]|nr:NAD-dependent epimerase/dehydratase family protein [Methanocella sp.]HTY89738.1 NAD-dependent epimerase/dehydratase family protein [Methanocella sp.]
MSPYGASKLSGEQYALMFHRAYRLPTTSIRPFNIYCPARVTRIDELAIPLTCRCSRILLSYSPILYSDYLIRHIGHRQPV